MFSQAFKLSMSVLRWHKTLVHRYVMSNKIKMATKHTPIDHHISDQTDFVGASFFREQNMSRTFRSPIKELFMIEDYVMFLKKRLKRFKIGIENSKKGENLLDKCNF